MLDARATLGVALLVAAGLAVPATALAAEKTKLAVLDIGAKGVDASLVSNLTDVATVALNGLGVFDVLSRADIQQMLSFEEDKQMVGCESDASCLAEIGGALGVALLVNGSVGKVGESYLVNMTLTDTNAAKVLAREQRSVSREEDLTGAVEAVSRLLVRGLLEGAQGFLVLQTPETGADVELDGRLIGVTPLPRQTLARGPHTLKVVKTGFITFARDFDVQPDQATVMDASLVPSLEFIDAYDSRANTWRIFAWVTGGVGVAAIGFGIGGWLWNNGQASAYERDIAAANCQVGAVADATGSCTEFESRRANIQTFDTVTQVVGWIGVGAVAASVFLFLYGPSPGIYDQYRPESGVSASLSVLPTAHGVAAAGLWRF